MSEPALLILEDGTVFEGESVGAPGISVGEVVFNTALTGYQEIITDPSYTGQLVTLTYPHIGNTGCNDEDNEASVASAAGLIVRNVPSRPSSWRHTTDLRTWLRARNIVAISEVDTRRLTRWIRLHGAQNAVVMAGTIDRNVALDALRAFGGLQGRDLAQKITTQQQYQWQDSVIDVGAAAKAPPPTARFRVVVYDFGVKHMILRMLIARGCAVHVVPAQTPFAQVEALQPDGVVFSNGPGDPAPCTYAIEAIQQCIAKAIPLLGICLGHQLLALAVGAKTRKMGYGHHGANHPVQDLASKQVWITSQNHGFAVDESSLPDYVEVTHRSLFDATNQGIALKTAPAFSFQGHPEASPGPHESSALFDRFLHAMQERHTER